MKTAVDWLIEMLHSPVCNTFINGKHRIIPQQLILDAKEKEKEQIQKAFSDGQETPINHPNLPHYSRDEYYNDNYKPETI